jgi:hypothetical protein
MPGFLDQASISAIYTCERAGYCDPVIGYVGSANGNAKRAYKTVCLIVTGP